MISSLIIISIILIKEKMIGIEQTKNHIYKVKKVIKKHAGNISDKVENIKGIEVKHTIKKVKKAKPHKKLKDYLRSRVNPSIFEEVARTRDLFIRQYRSEFTDKFIAIFFIIITVSMSIFALNPSFNKGIIADEPTIDPIKIIEQTKELPREFFSPEQILNPLPLLLGVCIVFIISLISIRRENEK